MGAVEELLDQIEHITSLTPHLAVLKAEVLLAKDSPKDKSLTIVPRNTPRTPSYGWR